MAGMTQFFGTPRLQCKVFYGQSNDRRFGNGRHQDRERGHLQPLAACLATSGLASDLTHMGEPKIHVGCSCETWETVENSGVVHLDQLTGLGVRELEAEEEEEEEEEEETGRPLVVEASDSNSYPQVLEQPASTFFYSTLSYHVTNRVTSDTYLCL